MKTPINRLFSIFSTSLILLAFVGVVVLQAHSAKAEGFSKDLYFGLKNDSEVTRLQQFLTSQGLYNGPITGNFFALTQGAVKNFQKKNAISPAAGYWGAKTRTKANGIVTVLPPASVPEPTPTTNVSNSIRPSSGTVSYGDIRISGYWLLTATTTDARWPSVPEPVQRDIDPRAVVALYCHGKNADDIWKGSGNIIHPKGYILTNRHVAANAKYCEVAMPGETNKLPTRTEIGNPSTNHNLDISGWRPYKAVNYFVPEQGDGLSDSEKFALDFAIMKIDSINDDCKTFSNCDPLPTSFPYNTTSNFSMPTSTAGETLPIKLELINYSIPQQPYEMLMYGYPSIGSGGGASHVLHGNFGYAVAYLAGDKQFSGYPIAMLTRVFYGTYGGASGSGVFYRGHIVGLTYAAFSDISVTATVIPMPFINMILSDNGKSWVLNPLSSGE